MRTIRYRRHEFRANPERVRGTLLSFIYDIPYLPACGVFPPRHILNDVLRRGGGDGGMSPGASWKPFDKEQAAVFELGKDIFRTTLKILEVRTGKEIELQDNEACRQFKTPKECEGK